MTNDISDEKQKRSSARVLIWVMNTGSVRLAIFLLLGSFPNTHSRAQVGSSSPDQTLAPRTGFVTVNAVRLHYLDWGGDGEPILFLAGFRDTAHVFDEFAPRFTDRFRVLGLTRRGFGESEKPPSGYDTNTRVEDIRQFLDAQRIVKVSLIGHSMAGMS